jgi:hypothetical protein
VTGTIASRELTNDMPPATNATVQGGQRWGSIPSAMTTAPPDLRRLIVECGVTQVSKHGATGKAHRSGTTRQRTLAGFMMLLGSNICLIALMISSFAAQPWRTRAARL